MISTLAVSSYRSLRDVRLELGPLNVVTGADGSREVNLRPGARLMRLSTGRVAAAALALAAGQQAPQRQTAGAR